MLRLFGSLTLRFADVVKEPFSYYNHPEIVKPSGYGFWPRFKLFAL